MAARRSLPRLRTLTLAAALLGAALPGRSGADARTCPAQVEQEIVHRINAARSSVGLRKLALDARLVEVARRHSREMADHDRFDHRGLDGSTSDQRVVAAGYPSPRTVGELLAAGEESPGQVVEDWLHSPGHRAVVLGSYRDLGVGCSRAPGSPWRLYWTLDLAEAWPERYAALSGER
jgi:uncharacterized protein YkwD